MSNHKIVFLARVVVILPGISFRTLSSINISGDRALDLRVSAKTWRI